MVIIIVKILKMIQLVSNLYEHFKIFLTIEIISTTKMYY